ncbi:MAG TPA: hypothetical protein ENK72_01585, partial [Epsilonproteobacteria bacterium]|nr:hypothetical protein [Campylobacterota bacterium]
MSYSKKETELLQQVEAIIPLISEASAASETLGKLRGDVLNALYEARVFHLFVPEVFGGNPIGLPAALEVFETISYADGATGWIVMIGAGGGLFSGFLEPSSAKEIFGAPTGVIAGSGMPRGRAIKTEGGYIVSGRWPYASGADHATTFTANCVIEGTDEILSIAVPAAQVTIHDTWHVFGMKATGSHDFSVESVYVKEAFTFDLFSTPKRDEPIYRCPLLPLASLTFGSVALGIARHALDLFMVYAGEKKRSGTDTTLLSDPNIQALVSKATE